MRLVRPLRGAQRAGAERRPERVIVLVFGYIRLYNSSSWLPLTNSNLGTATLLTFAYVALGLPYMYRAVDTGLRTIDVQTLTEAATIMGANQVQVITRVIFPNIIVAVLARPS